MIGQRKSDIVSFSFCLLHIIRAVIIQSINIEPFVRTCLCRERVG